MRGRLLREEGRGCEGDGQCSRDASHRIKLSHARLILEATLIDVEKRNVNLRLSAELLRKFRVMAAKRNLSMSHLATSAISKMILDADNYDARAKRAIERMKNAPNRGVGDNITWSREEVYDRDRHT
jgi:hypothetical protein